MKNKLALHYLRISLSIVALLFLLKDSRGQTYIVNDSQPVKGTTVVIAGKEYKRSGYHNFFWGKHYRKEWSTSIRVENFYLDTAKGGLRPIEKGGARQTKNLRLKDGRGKEYVLRSVNKDFGRGMQDKDIAGTFIARIAKDQVSIGHPYAAYTITPMIQAIGIYHTEPKMVFVPKQKELAVFNDEYGDQLYLFEERPDENQEDAANFGNSKNVIGSEKLFEKIYDENDNAVDQLNFLRARLFDIFLGDWGRHPDNWRWAEFDLGKQSIYRPVPRDRDQAYTKIDGFYPNLAGAIRKEVQGFNYKIKHIGGWNYPGRPLDHKFLNKLTLDNWLAQAKDLQRILTDSLIESSIRLMPPEWFAISGNEIIAKLKRRRDDLPLYAERYYAYLARTVTVLGSEKKELIKVNVLPGKQVIVDVFKINKEGITIDTPYYSRQFNPDETKNIFIYGLGKKDLIELTGEKTNKIKIRVIDPQDKDSIYSSAGNHKINDIAFFTGRKFEYDTVREDKLNFSIVPVFTPSTYTAFNNDPMDLFGRTGIKVSAGVVYTPQPWRKKEYQIVHSLNASYGFLRTSFNVGYVGRFKSAVGKWDLLIKGRLDDPAVENYFGSGNNSILANKERNFYRTLSQRVYGGFGIERNFEKKHHAELALIYQRVQYKKTDDKNIGMAPYIDPSVFQAKQYAGMEAAYTFDQSNGSICPQRGYTFSLSGGFLRNLSDTGSAFAKIRSEFAVYIPLSKKFTWATRLGGATLFGHPDFYHLNRLGGNAELRGYDRERFYGKSIFYTNTELRWITNTRNYFFNGRAGLVGFYDIGRVWIPDEKSNLWHSGYGMGVVIIPFNKITLTGMYGFSKEGNNLFFRAELFF
jgi:hypothetical protein